MADNLISVSLVELMNLTVAANGVASHFGLECAPFKVSWYNGLVKPENRLPVELEPAIAFSFISNPQFYHHAKKDYIERATRFPAEFKDDPDIMEHFAAARIQQVSDALSPWLKQKMDPLFYSDRPDEKSKFVFAVQTAGHVAGQACLCRREDLKNDPFDAKDKIFTVAAHPKYGGWFLYRGVLVFRNFRCDDKNFTQADPIRLLPTFQSDATKITLLYTYNKMWGKNPAAWRDVTLPEVRYDSEQLNYFSTPADDRAPLRVEWLKRTTE